MVGQAEAIGGAGESTSCVLKGRGGGDTQWASAGAPPRVLAVRLIVRNEREDKKKRRQKEKKERKRRFENENSISSFSLGGLHRARDFPSDGNLVGPVFGDENVPRTAGGKYLAPAISCYEAGPTKGSRDGFVNSFRTTDFSRFTAELRARVSRCEPRVEIGRLGEDFDRFR